MKIHRPLLEAWGKVKGWGAGIEMYNKMIVLDETENDFWRTNEMKSMSYVMSQ